MANKTISVFRKDLYEGKVVFVTGGGSGICYSMTQMLMEHGCSASIFGRRKANIESAAAELSRATGQKCIGVSGDVRKLESLQDAVKRTVDEFGRIDFVIAGAAGNFLAPLEGEASISDVQRFLPIVPSTAGLSANAFRTVIEIDTLGTYNTFKATIGELVKARGSLIAVSATLHYRASTLQAHVSAAKAGVDALVRVIAVEYGPRGVRANCIAPGPIAGTEGMDRLMPKELVEEHTKRIPMQRYGDKEDIAAASCFLFSPAATYITGTTLVVDGGDWHMSTSAGAGFYPDAFLPGGESKFMTKL
ncbi:2,4-dienoyl-CoA reductase (NADPH) [Rhodotorula paludigena]|uniref:2,4-dienoyl-CoA reductase (NADPH) n=1 Tax=Rhodotorula paludigena TaxID=86838 RepID=UPI003173E955